MTSEKKPSFRVILKRVSLLNILPSLCACNAPVYEGNFAASVPSYQVPIVQPSVQASSTSTTLPPPTFSSVYPSRGAIGQFFTITIQGSGFTSETQVKMGDSTIYDTVFVSPEELTCRVEGGISDIGSTSILIRNSDGQSASSAPAAFTFLGYPPQIQAIYSGAPGSTGILALNSTLTAGSMITIAPPSLIPFYAPSGALHSGGNFQITPPAPPASQIGTQVFIDDYSCFSSVQNLNDTLFMYSSVLLDPSISSSPVAQNFAYKSVHYNLGTGPTGSGSLSCVLPTHETSSSVMIYVLNPDGQIASTGPYKYP